MREGNSGSSLVSADEAFDEDTKRPHRAFSVEKSADKGDGMSADELDKFMDTLRSASASPMERLAGDTYRTHAPQSRRSFTPIQSSHEIGAPNISLPDPCPGCFVSCARRISLRTRWPCPALSWRRLLDLLVLLLAAVLFFLLV